MINLDLDYILSQLPIPTMNIESEIPTVWGTNQEGSLVFYCPFCRRDHSHGMAGIILNRISNHRAHCSTKHSYYNFVGSYNIKFVPSADYNQQWLIPAKNYKSKVIGRKFWKFSWNDNVTFVEYTGDGTRTGQNQTWARIYQELPALPARNPALATRKSTNIEDYRNLHPALTDFQNTMKYIQLLSLPLFDTKYNHKTIGRIQKNLISLSKKMEDQCLSQCQIPVSLLSEDIPIVEEINPEPENLERYILLAEQLRLLDSEKDKLNILLTKMTTKVNMEPLRAIGDAETLLRSKLEDFFFIQCKVSINELRREFSPTNVFYGDNEKFYEIKDFLKSKNLLPN